MTRILVGVTVFFLLALSVFSAGGFWMINEAVATGYASISLSGLLVFLEGE